MALRFQNLAGGASSGLQRVSDFRVYDGLIMEHDTITAHAHSGQATVAAPPQPAEAIRLSAGGSATAAEIEHGWDDPAPPPPDPAEAQPGLAQPPDVERLGNQIAELSSRIDAATYELLCHLREFDRHYGWDGFRSCAHWLNYRTGLALGAAREKLRVATALADLNHVSAAMARGQLSYSKVRALTRVATPTTEARLLAVALTSTAAHVERLVRAWRRADRDAAADGERDLLASRTLSMRVDEDGMVLVRGRLPAEVGAVLLRAVEAALEQVPATEADDRDEEGDDATIAQRRADALGLVAESALAGGLDPGKAADRFQVTVHVPAATLACRTPIGSASRVPAETWAGGPAAEEPASVAADPAPCVPTETRAAQPAVADPSAPQADPFEVCSAGRPPDEVLPEGDPGPAVGAEAEWSRCDAPGRGVRSGATSGTTPRVPAGTRSINPAAEERPRIAADPAPHVSAEERPALPAAVMPPSTTADQTPHVPVETPAAHAEEDGRLPADAGSWLPAAGRSAFDAASVSEGVFEARDGGAISAGVTTDPDAGQAVIEQAGGLHVGREVARRLACDTGLVGLFHDGGGEVLDVGRRTRTVPSALRRALLSRDRGQCQFPGCESHHCDAHHVEHWADGGETRLTNLVSLCRFHHRAVHEEGFRVVPGTGEAEGQFRFLRPDGEQLPAEPPPPRWQGEPLAPAEARLAAAGVSIGPHTATPEWYGEPLDLQAALDVLWEPAAAPAGVSQ